MRIVHVVHRYFPHVGGSEEVVRQMSERLVSRGHDVSVITRGVRPSEVNGVRVIPVGGISSYLSALDEMTRGADILMVYGQKVWCSDWLSFSRLHCPLIYFPVGFDSWNKSVLHRLYYEIWQRRICRKADTLVALTRSEEDFLRSWVNHPRLSRVPNGVDWSYWQGEAGDIPEGVPRPFMLHAGGYHPTKRVDRLLRIAATLRERGVDVGLVTCGPNFEGAAKRLRSLAKSLRLGESYLGLGEVQRSTLKGLLTSCSVFVSASSFEGFGLTFLEALACGKPVVSGPVGVAPELAEKTGNVFIAHGMAGFVEGVEAFLQGDHDPKEAKDVATRYDWDRIIDLLEDVYLDAAQRGPPHRDAA
jgi:alpha-1,3-mannosyltransferase